MVQGYRALAQCLLEKKEKPYPVPAGIIKAAAQDLELDRLLGCHLNQINQKSGIGYRVDDLLQNDTLRVLSMTPIKGEIDRLQLEEKSRVTSYLVNNS